MVPAALAQLLSFLVLEGAEPLLGLCVQLFQMRRSPTGEENVVLKFISYRSWPLAGPCALTVVTLGLSRASAFALGPLGLVVRFLSPRGCGLGALGPGRLLLAPFAPQPAEGLPLT